MRRTVGLLAVMSAMLILAVGVAHAATKVCDQTTCQGTNQRDVLTGTQIDNVIFGKAKGDTITDNVSANNVHDHDVIYAQDCNDVIDVSEGNESPQDSDTVRCGPGTDIVYFDQNVDTLSAGCERKVPE